MDRGESFHVFISHPGEYKATLAEPLYERLEQLSITAFLDKKELNVGENAPKEMERAMETARIGIFLLGPEFIAKKWPMKELFCFQKRLKDASEKGLPQPLLIPVFYGMSVKDCTDDGFFGRKDSAEKTVCSKNEVYSEKDIRDSFKMVPKYTGIENLENATNGDTASEKKARELLVGLIASCVYGAVLDIGIHLPPPEFSVFISHPSEYIDSLAFPLYMVLKERGIKTCWPNALPSGTPFFQAIERAAETADIGIFLLGPEFLAKHWTMKELRIFQKRVKECSMIKKGRKPPVLIPVFYHMKVNECTSSKIFGSMDRDGLNLFVKFGFFDRVLKEEDSLKALMSDIEELSECTGILCDETESTGLAERISNLVENTLRFISS